MKLKYENITGSASAIAKEISYALNQRWFSVIEDLIKHNLIEVKEVEPQIIHSLHGGGYEIGPQIIFKVKVPEQVLKLEQENKDLKNKIEVFTKCFSKGEKVLNEELQKIYNLQKELNK